MDKKREILRDPFRALMMAVPTGKAVAALCAAVCAVFFVVVMRMADAAGMEGPAVIALFGAAGLAILLWGMAPALEKEKQPLLIWAWPVLLCVIAIAAHLLMLDIKPGRYGKVLAPLFDDMWNYEMITGFAWADDGWTGVYLFICTLISRLETFSQLVAVKLVDMICQCLCGAAAVRLVRVSGGKTLAGVGAMLACVLAPTMLFNAGCWAQCDATFAMFALWGLYFLLSGKPLAGCILWGLALGTKLQSAFLFPLLIVLFMNRRVNLGHILALAAAAFLSQIAFVIDGQGVATILNRYAEQIAIAKDTFGLTDNAPGVYSLMNVASVREFSGMGKDLGFASALIVAAALLRSRRKVSNEILLLAALLLSCGLPLILPQMTARSLYLAGMLAFCCAGTPRRFAVAVTLELVSFCSYMQSIFNVTVMPMSVLSMIAIGAAAVVAVELITLIMTPEEAEA